jgi:branched-subunit amino acid aminotransferase/4-amino-4-deoxychorismate lyase
MKFVANGAHLDAPASGTTELPVAAGVFETLLLLKAEPVFFQEHWTRFAAGCEWHGFKPPVNAADLRGTVERLARENDVRTGVVRFAAWRNANGVEWRVEATPPRPHMAKSAFRVGVQTGFPVGTPDRAFKHLGRRRWLDTLRDVRASGLDEALVVNVSGHVVEGCVSNVFWIDAGALHTPALQTGALPGIIRHQVIAAGRELGLKVVESAYRLADLQRASEIWLTNSLIGVRPVSELAGEVRPGSTPVLLRLRESWRARHAWDLQVVV